MANKMQDFLDYMERRFFETHDVKEDNVMNFVDYMRDLIRNKKIKTLVFAENGKECFRLGIAADDPVLKNL